jgi:membrane protease YdiL (CAAX protease family)
MPPDPIETTPAEPVMDAPFTAEPVLEAPFAAEPAAPLAVEPPPLPVRREPFWGYLDLVLMLGFVCAGLVGIVLLGAVLVAIVPKLKDDPMPLVLPLQFVFYLVVYAGFVAVFKLRYRAPVLVSLGWRSSRLNPLFAAIGGIALALGLAFLAALLHTPQVPSPIDKLVNSPASLALFVITAVVVAPFFEELLFRGFVQPLLSRTFGVIAGVLITAVLFGALHAPEYSWAWQYALVVSLAGAVFGWIRARTNSVVPGTVMHGFYNLAFVVGYLATTHGIFK